MLKKYRANQKLFSKNLHDDKTFNKQNINEKDFSEIGTEDETIINALLVSSLNENTLYNSVDNNDFRYEQFEHELKTNEVILATHILLIT